MTLKRASSKQKLTGKESPPPKRPKLRPYLEAVAAKTESGESTIGLKDGLEISPRILWLEPELFYVLRFFDGRHQGEEIRAAFLHHFGDFLLEQDYRHLVQRLDENFMLENSRFRKQHEKRVAAFRANKVRPMMCRGSSYPARAESCAAYFDSELEKLALESNPALSKKTIKALILPHIDFRLGISSYLKGYHLLSQAKPSDLYIILGTSHQGLSNPFALTLLDFATPFGAAVTDKEMVKKLTVGGYFDYFKDEYIFKNEHSIEFQQVLLKYFATRQFKTVPILTSFSHSVFKPNQAEEHTRFRQFVDRLKRVVSLYRGNVTIIASVDFAHIGPRYGDASALDPSLLAQMERNDRSLFQALLHCDQNLFQKTIIENENRFRICGYAPLTTLLELLQDEPGHVVDYSSAIMDSQKSTVSFATIYYC